MEEPEGEGKDSYLGQCPKCQSYRLECKWHEAVDERNKWWGWKPEKPHLHFRCERCEFDWRKFEEVSGASSE